MTNIGDYPDEQYHDDFPLDFGNNSRGTFVINKAGDKIGLVEAHRRTDGSVCAGHLYWVDPQPNWSDTHPLWSFAQSGPGEHDITLTPSILCTPCQHHGFITAGKWVACDDSKV